MRRLIVPAIVLMAVGAVGSSAGGELQASDPQGAPSVTVLGSRQADSILGKEIRSKTGENMGRLIDVLVDRMGRPRAAVIDVGGFMGVGSRKIAIDWNSLRFEADGTGDTVTTDMTRDQVKAAPEYKEKRAVVVLGSSGAPAPGD
jgi:hypothetical protein